MGQGQAARRPGVVGILAVLSGPAHAAGLEDVIFYDEGLRIESRDDRVAILLEWRLQFRGARPGDASVDEAGDVPIAADPWGLDVRRARLRLGGHLGWKWLRFYTETDLLIARPMDVRLMIGTPDGPIDVYAGLVKSAYGREQQAGSREQQFADRSMSNAFFTTERQIGVELRSQLLPARVGGSVGVYLGNGAAEIGTDRYPMLTGRLQWHPFGRIENPTQSDLGFREDPALTLTWGGAWTRGPYTKFKTLGGGQLAGFEDGGPDRYVLTQGLFDASYAWNGITAQGEANVKGVYDTEEEDTTVLVGGYAQAGWLPHGLFPEFPKAYEIAVRGSWVDPDVVAANDAMTDLAVAANAYVVGHRAKATAEASYLLGGGVPGWRVRLQWDFSF